MSCLERTWNILRIFYLSWNISLQFLHKWYCFLSSKVPPINLHLSYWKINLINLNSHYNQKLALKITSVLHLFNPHNQIMFFYAEWQQYLNKKRIQLEILNKSDYEALIKFLGKFIKPFMQMHCKSLGFQKKRKLILN